MTRAHPRIFGVRAATAGAVLALAAVLGACQTIPTGRALEGIGFRQERFQEFAAMETYRACVKDAFKLDTEARAQGNPGGYLASARLIEKCEAELGPEAATVAQEERMRAYGLTIQNYLKGGDAASARHSLARFEQAFPANDLYYPDGASFRETMATLLGQRDQKGFGQFALLNVSGGLKDEMRRIAHWKNN